MEKNKGGRPRMFNKKEEMQVKIDKYFEEECKPTIRTNPVNGSPVLDRDGNPSIEYNHPTISGLALYIGFCSRKSLYEYKEHGEFRDTVEKAVSKIEDYAEKNLFSNNKATGAIFWLKNRRNKSWQDTTQTEVSTPEGKNINVVTSAEEAADIYKSVIKKDK